MCTGSPNSDDQKRHFVLVHGAAHGAWCWYKLSTLLTSVGHNVTSLDLAASGVNPKQVDQLHSFSDYVEPLIEFMESLPPKERVILVGHSMGGAAISIVMERFPEKISTAVFATAFMPGPNLSCLTVVEEVNRCDAMDTQFVYDQGPNNPPTRALFGPKRLSSMFYQLSPPEDLTLALSLVRFFPFLVLEEIKLTKEKYGSICRVYIVCDQDLAIGEDVQRWMIKENPPQEVKVINGSDHMVMFSKPQELFSNLQEIAEKYS